MAKSIFEFDGKDILKKMQFVASNMTKNPIVDDERYITMKYKNGVFTLSSRHANRKGSCILFPTKNVQCEDFTIGIDPLAVGYIPKDAEFFPITIDTAKNSIVIGKVKMQYVNLENAFEIMPIDTKFYPAGDFIESAIDFCYNCIPFQTNRPVCKSLWVIVKNGFATAVGTDTFTFASIKSGIEMPDCELKIPLETLSVIRKNNDLSISEIALRGNTILMRSNDDILLESSMVEGVLPDYNRISTGVINGRKGGFQINRKRMKQSLIEARPIWEKIDNAMTSFEFEKDYLNIFVHSKALSAEFSDKIPILSEKDLTGVKYKFSAKMVSDFLSDEEIDGDINISMSGDVYWYYELADCIKIIIGLK